MKRLYYLTHDINVAESVSKLLHVNGISDWNFHVLSKDDAGIKKHHLHAATPIHELDILRSGERGLIYGIILAVIMVVLVGQFTSWFDMFGYLGVFGIAIMTIGFSTWIGGFVGVQSENYKIRRFHDVIERGGYLLMIDVKPKQKASIEILLMNQHGVNKAGEDTTLVTPFHHA
ncbi:MAG: hypothetical protein ACPG3T_01850 [Pseudomonadales bacterium]